jgi:hypothetical protein
MAAWNISILKAQTGTYRISFQGPRRKQSPIRIEGSLRKEIVLQHRLHWAHGLLFSLERIEGHCAKRSKNEGILRNTVKKWEYLL